ncbi:DUF2057 family protein [Vibrio aestuarianus]|uniref:DUF2057 family protein n=1 Tax=Vibrio aestuarianus TaxID=28171 RepID=UPI00237D25B8|nr:DUF2057 family protein [Vibrio aestuarianus]
MKIFHSTLFVLTSALFSSFCLADVPILEGGYGVNILVVNGTEVKNSKQVPLVVGENQIVVSYSGKLKTKSGGKSEYHNTVPYISVIDVNNDSNIEVFLASKSLSEAKQLEKEGQPLFSYLDNGTLVQSEQLILPTEGGFLPYGDVLGLVQQYNAENGLIYENGKIRELKAELKNIQQQPEALVSQDGPSHLVSDTESTLQLKLWYTRASADERKAFRRWMIDQE